MTIFLNGAAAMGSAIAGLLFLRFWRDSRDGLLLAFAMAFWIFGASYVVLGIVPLATERVPYVFLVRLIGFVVILAGVGQKNRRERVS